MNLKAGLLLCLVFFAATLITSVAYTPLVSFSSQGNAPNVSKSALLNNGFVEPLGDPVDNPAEPK